MVDLVKEFSNFQENTIALVLLNPENYMDSTIKILDMLVNKKKLPGIYVTVNKPYNSLVSFLNKRGIDTSKLFFIDMITSETTEKTGKIDNCLFIESPKSLTDLSIALSEAVASLPGDKFLFLDTLSTLLVYNQLTTVTKFAHFLTTKMRQWNICGLLLSMEKEIDEKLQAQLSQFCDMVINI